MCGQGQQRLELHQCACAVSECPHMLNCTQQESNRLLHSILSIGFLLTLLTRRWLTSEWTIPITDEERIKDESVKETDEDGEQGTLVAEIIRQVLAVLERKQPSPQAWKGSSVPRSPPTTVKPV